MGRISLAVMFLVWASVCPSKGVMAEIIYSAAGFNPCAVGILPTGEPLVSDQSSMYKFSLSTGGVWTKTTIATLKNSKNFVCGQILVDKSSNVFASFTIGGGSGGVLKLSPPTSGSTWLQSVIWSMTSADGYTPNAGMVLDTKGNIFGTTYGDTGISTSMGQMFKLSPPASGKTAWKKSTAWQFPVGSGSVITQSGPTMFNGKFYIANARGESGSGSGSVIEATPPVSATGIWGISTIYSFVGGSAGGTPVSIVGTKFGLAGGFGGICDTNCGGIYLLSPPTSVGAAWGESILAGPNGDPGPGGSIISDRKGDIFGSRGYWCGSGFGSGCGAVIELVAPTAAKPLWQNRQVSDFGHSGEPSVFAADASGNLFGVLNGGNTQAGCLSANCGAVFLLSGVGYVP